MALRLKLILLIDHKHILLIDLLSHPVAVLTEATLTSPATSGWTIAIRPIGQQLDGV